MLLPRIPSLSPNFPDASPSLRNAECPRDGGPRLVTDYLLLSGFSEVRARAFPSFFSLSLSPFPGGAERYDLGRPREKGGRVRDGESVVVFQEVKGREGREVNLEIWRPLAGLYR